MDGSAIAIVVVIVVVLVIAIRWGQRDDGNRPGHLAEPDGGGYGDAAAIGALGLAATLADRDGGLDSGGDGGGGGD